VVDSSSPQNEVETIRQYQNSFPHISYVRTAERETLYGAWNTALLLAQGEFVTNANTDDRHRADALEVLARALADHPEVDCAYGDCLCTTVENETYELNTSTEQYSFKDFFAPDVILHYQFGPQALWRRSVHTEVGAFDKNFKAAGDWEFNFRFNLAGRKAWHVSEALGLFLKSAQSVSNADQTSHQEQTRLRQKYTSTQNLLALYAAEAWPVVLPSDQAAALNHFALRALRFALPWEPGGFFSDYGIALHCLQAAVSLNPENGALISNLASALALSGKKEEALQIYTSLAQAPGEVAQNLLLLQSGDLQQLRFFANL
jgi:hypothetical protein